eukprot:Partr_v1_DN26524_c0_g2_i2_m3796 putative transmembrane transport
MLDVVTGGLYVKLNNIEARHTRVISLLVINVLYPCLLFSKTIISMERIRIESLGIVIVASIFYVLVGLLLGTCIMLQFKGSIHFRYAIIAASTFGNWSSLTNAVIFSLGSSPPFNSTDVDVGIAYVAIFNVLTTILLFSLGFALIKRDYAVKVAPDSTNSSPSPVVPLSDQPHMEMAAIDRRFSDTPHPGVRNAATITNPGTNGVIMPLSQRHLIASWFDDENVKYAISILITPANVSMVIALIFAYIPSMRKIFLAGDYTMSFAERTRNAPLGFLFESIDMAGMAGIPLSVMVIGGVFMRLLENFNKHRKLVESDSEGGHLLWGLQKSSYKIAAAITVSRLLITPVIGILFWEFLLTRVAHWILPEEKMLRFVLMFQSCVPTAQVCILLAQMSDPNGLGLDVAFTGLLQYLVSLVTVSGWLVGIFLILATF